MTVDVGVPSTDWIWGSALFLLSVGLYYIGDKRWARKPPNGREYAIAPTEDEIEKHRADREKEVESVGKTHFVQRKQYHDDMNTVTVELQNVRLDVAGMAQVVAVLSDSLKKVEESGKESSEALQRIALDVRELNATWRTAWEMKHGAKSPA